MLRKKCRIPEEFLLLAVPQGKSRKDSGTGPKAHARRNQSRSQVGKTVRLQHKQEKQQLRLLQFATQELRPQNRRRNLGKKRQSRRGTRPRISAPIVLERFVETLGCFQSRRAHR